MLNIRKKVLIGTVMALSVVSFSPELPSLGHFSPGIPSVVYAANSGSASDIISEITGGDSDNDDTLTKDDDEGKYRSVTGIHLINNLCQNSDYKLTKDQYNKIKTKINPSSKTVEDYNPEDTRQNLIDTDSTTSYLISNNVISRFESFSYKNGKVTFRADPLVMPTDTNYTSKIYRKSDLYVALYKAVYGVLDSKPVVFNLPSIRTVNGSNSVVSDVVNYKGKEGTASFAEGDYWAYVSPNVYEQYLAKLLDKGLIDESELIQDNNHTFVSEYKKLSKKSVKPAWYNDGTVAYAGKNNKALGKSFTYNSKCKLKHKKYNYFVDEQIDEMEALSIIEDFMRLTEKNMTKTEANIITYKYGANALSGLAEKDTDTVSFLVAKGILNFEDEDFPNYYSTFSTDSAYDLIYRFANKDARYDFSKVTLTDEESFWAKKGFSQNKLNVIRTTTVPTVETVESGVTYKDIVESNNPDEDTEDLEENDGWKTIGKVKQRLEAALLHLSPVKQAYALKANTYENYKVVKLFDNKMNYTYNDVALAQLSESSPDVEKIEKTGDYTKITFVIKARSSDDAVSAVDGKISCELSTEGTEVPCFTSVENSNGKVTNMISKKSIQQLFPEISIIHDKLLENTNTGCEALLMGESGYAIVGTKVIVSDDLIVHDAGDDVYYNLELITSLLTNSYLKELDKKIGNQITSLYISDSNLNESRYKVYSDSTLLNKTDVIQLKVKNANGTEKSTKFYNMDSMNRGMNSASRTFKIKDSQGRDASITVVVDLDFVVPSGTAFADSKLSTNLLNGPLTANNISATYFSRPSDSEPDLQNWWDSNLGCSNALYNFLYGTNGIVYVESGYLAPSLTILRSSDAITDKQVSQVFKNFKLYDINGISYKKFFGSDLDKFWEFYYDANANTGLTNLSKTLAKESRSFQQITGTSSTSGINYQGKFFVTNANTIYRSLDNADDVITKNLKVNHGSKRIDLTTQTQGENSVSPQTGDKIQYEYTDNNKNKKTTTWTYCGIEDGYYVLEPDIDLMKNASSDWKKGTPVLQTAGGSSYTISTLATDNTIQYYLKQFYMVGFPDIWDKIDVSSYTSKTASSKLWKANATMFGDNGFSQGRDQQYYLSGGKVYSRQIISKDGKRVNTLAEVSRPSDDMNVAAIPVAYVPTGDISITSSTSGNNVVFKATAGYKGTALHYGNVFLKNINQSVIDYSVYKSMKTKKINELNDNDTIYIGTTLFCKKGDYFVSSPITNDQLVATAKAAGTTSIKGQAVGIFMGLKVRVDGSERNLSEYVIDADTGTLYNEGNGEDGIVYKQGGTVNVWKDNKAQGTEVSAKQICIKVKFDDNLMCRPINDKGNAYTLLYANTYLGSESLGNLPFLSEKLDYNRFSNVNATLSMSKFNLSEFAKVAKKEFLKRFRDRFFDDSRGLIYNIILALASYLTVMSWLVYGVLRYGIGRHLLEMIANPTRMQSFRGIDLIKVFTFGIYSLDTEPTLARFFTTSLINVAIIYVVVFVLPH